MDNFSFAKFDFEEITRSLDYAKGRVGEDDQEVIEIILAIFATIQRNIIYCPRIDAHWCNNVFMDFLPVGARLSK